jgi:hypothetical protein
LCALLANVFEEFGIRRGWKEQDMVFDIDKQFTKSDLDILTELYKLLEKNIE